MFKVGQSVRITMEYPSSEWRGRVGVVTRDTYGSGNVFNVRLPSYPQNKEHWDNEGGVPIEIQWLEIASYDTPFDKSLYSYIHQELDR